MLPQPEKQNLAAAEIYESVPEGILHQSSLEKLSISTEIESNADESQNLPEHTNPLVDSTPLNAIDAFEKFAGHVFDARKCDFSGSVAKKGTEFARKYSQSLEESPIERLHRLRMEVKAFQEDLENETANLDEDANVNAVKDEISDLSKQLEAIRTRGILRSGMNTEIVEEIIQKIQSSVTETSESGERERERENGGTVYELYAGGVQALGREGEREIEMKEKVMKTLGELAERVKTIENRVGVQDRSGNSGSVFSELKKIREDIDVIQRIRDEHGFQQKIRSASEELETLLKKKQKAEEMGLQPKLEENYTQIAETIHRWDETARLVPGLIEHLHTLKSIHRDFMTTAKRLSDVESNQSDVEKEYTSCKELLSLMKETMSQNMEVVAENVSALREEMNKL